MDAEWEPEKVNRFELGLDIYARLQQELEAAQVQREMIVLPEIQGVHQPALGKIPPSLPESASALWVETPSLHNLLASLSPLPDGNVLIGASEDELPLLFDLTHPEPGSLLLLGGKKCGKTRLLRSILASGCTIHSPRRFRFCVLGPTPEELNPLLDLPHCYKIAEPNKDSAYRLVIELANLAEERRSGRRLGAPVVLAIGDLTATLDALEGEVQDLLAWLIRYGPESQVVTVAEINTLDFEQASTAAAKCFGAWLVGSLKDADWSASARFTARYPSICTAAETLIHGAQFSVYTGQEWIPFWIPNFNEEELK